MKQPPARVPGDVPAHSPNPQVDPTFCAVALTLLVVVATFHFWKLGSAPKGFYGDEASVAYNAYCIARTGADEYGTRWPLFFRALEFYGDPISTYSAAMPIRIFGLHQWTARLPAGVYDLMACGAFFLLLRQWRFGKWLSLGGSFALSVMP